MIMLIDKNKIKPCPFCGSFNLKLDYKSLGFDCRRAYIKCLDCDMGGASGSAYDRELDNQAIEAWNRRA